MLVATGEPPQGDPLEVVRSAAAASVRADEELRAAVDAARDAGLSWHQVGLALGRTGEAARLRYRKASPKGG